MRSRRLCNGACLLQKNRQIPDGAQGVRMHGAKLTFSPTQGRAIELLCLQGGLWMDDSRVASYAVARWALCCDPQLVRGNVLLVMQCGTLILQTPKPANLRINFRGSPKSVRGESGKQENSPVPVFPQLLCKAIKHSLNSERGATKNYDTCLHLR